MEKESPYVSIIIPVRNCEKTIKKTLESIFYQNYKNFEVIIIDDGSTDNTKKILEEFKDKIKLLSTPSTGPSKARNEGIKISSGKYIAFTDGDCIVDKNWIQELLKPFVDVQHLKFNSDLIIGVGGDQLSPEDDTELGKIIQKFMKTIGFLTEYIKPNTQLIEVDHNPTCNVMYKKEVFNKVGYFLEGLWPGEDVELDYRIKKAGYKLLYNPYAIVYHYRPDRLNKFCKMMFNYGKVQSILVKMYGIFRKIHFVPFVTFVIAVLITGIFLNKFFYGLSALLSFSILIFVYFLKKTKNLCYSIYFLFLFCLTITFWNIGFIVGLFPRRKCD